MTGNEGCGERVEDGDKDPRGRRRINAMPCSPARIAIWCTVVFLIAVLPVAWMTDQVLHANAEDRARLELAIRLERFGDAIAASMNRRLTLLTALTTFLQTNEGTQGFEPSFRVFATGLFSSIEGLTSVRVLTEDEDRVVYAGNGDAGSVLSRVTPLSETPPQQRALERAIRVGRVSVAGPQPGPDGGQFLTAFRSVFDESGEVVATVSLTFLVDPLIREAGLDSSQKDLRVVLRTTSGRSFYGQPIVDSRRPVVGEIDGDGYSWELAAVPLDGWRTSTGGEFQMLRAAGVSIVSLLAILVYLIVDYQQRLKANVRRRTAELRAANQELQQGVAERQAVIEELRETTFGLMHAMPGIARIDEAGALTHVNSVWASMVGREPGDLQGQRWDTAVHPDEIGLARSAFECMRREGKAEFEFRLRASDGLEMPCEALLVRRDSEDDSFTGCHLFLRDVRQRKERERKERVLYDNLARARRMESVGKLAAGVAHDLNNILGPLVAYPDVILATLPKDHPARGDIITIRDASMNAKSVIQDLLTLARRSRNEYHPVDIGNVVTDYLCSAGFREMQGLYPEIAVHTFIPPEPLRVKGSKTQLQQVLMNLITNAFEAMEHLDHGTLTIRVACHDVREDVAASHGVEPGRHVMLSVEDNGVGIDPSARDQIYEPFYSTKGMGRSGSGLGLTVAFSVVRDHNGFIDVESVAGRGARFVISIPTTDEEEPPVFRESEVIPHGNEKVLVVDDRESQRELASRLLAELGYEVESAENGRAAIECLERQQVDLVILDMIMEQGFDGLDTYEAIRLRKPDQRCIIASGYAANERVQKALELGVMAYLAKPYTQQNIGILTRQVLDQPLSPVGDGVGGAAR